MYNTQSTHASDIWKTFDGQQIGRVVELKSFDFDWVVGIEHTLSCRSFLLANLKRGVFRNTNASLHVICVSVVACGPLFFGICLF